ncbi:nucleosome assembly protein [Trametopsis cervina]|nr:nucleosome assembly protein [Trametopsis cervina]
MGDTDYDELPVDTKRVIQGMRGAEEHLNHLHHEFAKEVHALERKWAQQFQSSYDHRRALLTGQAAPTAEEIIAGEKRSHTLNDEYKKLPPLKGHAKSVAVDGFWLQVLEANLDTSTHIQESDKPALRSLVHIDLTHPPHSRTPEFVIAFHFTKNRYFTNDVLKLSFVYQDRVDAHGNLEYGHVNGDTIQWKPKQNLIKQHPVQRRSGEDEGEEEDDDGSSFFSLFEPPSLITRPAGSSDDEDEREFLLDHIFDIGIALKNAILNRATDYFIGDGNDLDSDDDDSNWSDFDGADTD